MRPGTGGWRCRIRPHRWMYACSEAIVLVVLASEQPPPPLWCPGPADLCVSFNALGNAPTELGSPVFFMASLTFEAEGLSLPTRALRDAHAAFHSAYSRVNGLDLSEQGKRDLNREHDA